MVTMSEKATKQKKRLLVVSTQVPPDTAGAEKVAWETARRLAPHYEVHVLTTTANAKPPTGVRVHVIPDVSPLTLYYSTVGWHRIGRILEEHPFDIVHCHMSLPWGFVFRNVKARKVVTMHGCEYLKNSFLYRALAKTGFGKADCLTSPSQWLRNYVKKHYGYDSVVIRNGIDRQVFFPVRGLQKDNVVLFVGRLVEIKGVWEFAEMARRMPGTEFWVAGEGPLHSCVSLPNLKWLGFLEGLALARVYNQATVCAFPSYTENFPTVGLEAISCARAVAATQRGFAEIIDSGKDGILVPQGDMGALQKAVEKLLGDRLYRLQIEEAALAKSAEFDYDRIISQYRQLYEGK